MMTFRQMIACFIIRWCVYFLCRIAALARCGLLLQMEYRGLSVMTVSPAKTAEPIKMPFGMWTQVGPKKLCGVQLPQRERHVWGGWCQDIYSFYTVYGLLTLDAFLLMNIDS